MQGIQRRDPTADRWFVPLSLVLLLLLLFVTMRPLLNATFDCETLTRFIIPFHLAGWTDPVQVALEGTGYGIFRPLLTLSFLADYSLFGVDPVGYHLTDLLLTGAVCIMAFLLFRRRFGGLVALVSTSLWVLLPAQSYSHVTFLGRNDRIMALFLMGSLLAYDRALDSGEPALRRSWLKVSLVVFVVGILAKESMPYYGLFLFAWGMAATGRGLVATMREDRLLWLGVISSGIMYIAVRMILGMPMGDAGAMPSVAAYLNQLGIQFSWGFPFEVQPSVMLYIGIVVILLLAGVIASRFIPPVARRIPAAVRVGVFCLLVGMVHLPLFWIQHCFLWLPWLWGSLAVAVVLVNGVRLLGRRFGRAGLSAGAAVIVLLLGGAWSWSMDVCLEQAWFANLIASEAHLLDESCPGPEYVMSRGFEDFPELKYMVRFSTVYFMPAKFRVYLRAELELVTGDPRTVIIWE